MESDPEACLYTTIYKLNDHNIAKAEHLVLIIATFIDDFVSIFSLLR